MAFTESLEKGQDIAILVEYDWIYVLQSNHLRKRRDRTPVAGTGEKSFCFYSIQIFLLELNKKQ
jgi:hypothetical protein